MKRSLPLQLAPVLAAALGLAAVGTAPAQPAAQPAAKPRPLGRAPVTVNFVNADIEAVTRALRR
jgi:type II secretory pathway component GspD/PulD (secretin)